MAGGTNNPFYINIDTPCDELVIQAQLISPRKEVLNKMKVGDWLVIKLNVEQDRVIAYFHDEIAGSIITKEILRLMQCLKKIEFLGNVRNVEDGSCSLTIKSKQKWGKLF
jgi:hypothetical protein